MVQKKRVLTTRLFAIKIRRLKVPGKKGKKTPLWCRDSLCKGFFFKLFLRKTKQNKNSFYVEDHFCSILNARSVVPPHCEMHLLHEIFFINGNV